MTTIGRAITIVILGAIFAFAGRELASFVEMPIPAYRSPDVWSLTTSKVEWEYSIGSPSRIEPRRVVLPMKVFRNPERRPGDLLYYTTRLTLPPALVASKEPLVFHSLIIWAKRYEIYADGDLIDAGDSQQVQVHLPPKAVEDGVVDMRITVDPGDLSFQGVAHWGEVAIGTASALAPIRSLAHELKTTFYLWFVIPKLTLCLLFALLYLGLSQAKEHFTLVLFGTFGAVKMLLFTTYADRLLPVTIHGATLAWIVDCATQISLMAFLYQYFRWHSPRLARGFWIACGLMVVALIVGIHAQGLTGVTSSVILSRKILRVVALLAGLGFAGITMRRLHRSTGPEHRRLAARSIFGFFAVYLAFVGIEHGGIISGALQGVIGFTFELLLFILLAALTVVEFRATVLSRNEERRGRIQAEEEATTFKAITRTTQMLAHDVRKPFSMLRSVFRVIEGETDLARLQRGARGLTAELDRSMASVDGMLADIMELGVATELMTAPQDLEPIFGDAMRLLLGAAPPDVSVRWDIAHRHKPEINSTRLGRVALNLIENALQATGPGGRVWVATTEAHGWIQVTVGNSGSFVPADEREKIFEIFYTRGKSGGTGLGLAVARQVVERHGGRIRCESDQVKGTEFKLTLRASSELATPPPNDLPQSTTGFVQTSKAVFASGAGPLIALVEDDVFLREAWMLSVRDARLDVFATGEALMERCLADPGYLQSIAFVVTDFHFGNGSINGAELAMRLKNLRPGLPIALCSESGADLSAVHQQAFVANLEKRPHSWEELRAFVESRRAGPIRASSSNS